MTMDLVLKPSCRCGSTSNLYGSNCKHMTLCLDCGKKMAKAGSRCFDCGSPVTRLIREYNVRASPSNEKNYFIGKFMGGLPSFSKKKSPESEWSIHKDGFKGRMLSEALRERFKNKPWLLEDGTGQHRFHGQMESSQSVTYLLMAQGKEYSAIPAGSWYNFNKAAQYKQLTLEEAEEKMKNRRKTAEGYERWMMKAAADGPAAFGVKESLDDMDVGKGGARGRKKASGDSDEGNVSDKGEESKDEEASRKGRLGLAKSGGEDDDDEEGKRGGDLDDDDDIEKGDDWEHEDIFTDDDEAVGGDHELPEELAPAPPEIKQDDEDEDEEDEEGKLSTSGKELQKLLGRGAGVSDSDGEGVNANDDVKDDISAPKQEVVVKEEPSDNNSPSKPTVAGSTKGNAPTPSKPSKGKRKADDSRASNTANPKKVKTEEPHLKKVKTEVESKSGMTCPVTEEEMKAVLLEGVPLTTKGLVSRFKSRLKCRKDKLAFADTLKRISKIQKNPDGGAGHVLLK